MHGVINNASQCMYVYAVTMLHIICLYYTLQKPVNKLLLYVRVVMHAIFLPAGLLLILLPWQHLLVTPQLTTTVTCAHVKEQWIT